MLPLCRDAVDVFCNPCRLGQTFLDTHSYIIILYSHEKLYIHLYMQNHNDAIKTSGHRSLEKYTSHFIERVVYERELETEQRLQHITPTLIAITTFLFRSSGLLNRGPGGPASVVTCFSFYHPLSNSSEALNSNCSIGGPEGPLCWVLVLSTASYLQLTWTSCRRGSIIIWRPLFFLRGSQFCTQFNPSTVKVISWYSSTGCTCYLHRCISYFDSSAGVNMQ